LSAINGGGGGMPLPQNPSEYQLPDKSTDVAGAPDATPQGNVPKEQASTDAGKDFVSRVLGSTERVWSGIFQQHLGQQYQKPPLVMFSGYVQSGCGTAQSAMGPFYCPVDGKVYIDLSFYQDMKNKLGAPGDFAQAYVVAHEVGHHVQNLLGIAEKVTRARAQSDEVTGNALQVRMELQADCFAGIWAAEADATKHILEQGDIEEALNAASQIGDDRLQKRSQGYVVEENFTHGSSEQRVRWFKKGLGAQKMTDCDTFASAEL
jgi:predicted metalloprotease